MKLTKITKQKAEHLIVYGKDQGFNILKIKDIPLTIYHREYENKHYDIAEMNTETTDNNTGEQIVVTTYYLLDPQEVLQLFEYNEDYFKGGD